MQRSDRYWVNKVRSSRTEDFNAFFDHFFPRLFHFALARLKDYDLAEEAVQEGLCKAVSHIDSYLGEAALFSWLCTITRREIGRLLKREHRHAAQPLLLEDGEALAHLESLESLITQDPQLYCDRLQRGDQVRLALSYLPQGYAEVLEWRYIQGCSVSEIATKLNKSYKAAESMLSRSRQVFKDAFKAVAQSSAAGRLEEGSVYGE